MSQNFCSDCGNQLSGTPKFCPNCGKPVNVHVHGVPSSPLPAVNPTVVQPPSSNTQQATIDSPSLPDDVNQAEKIVTVIDGLARKKGLLHTDNVLLVITGEQIAVCIMSTDIIKRMTKESYEKARASGSSKFTAMFSADSWVEYAKKRYSAMSPDEILREHPENVAYKMNQLRGIQIRRGRVTGSVKGSGFNRGGTTYANGEMMIGTVSGEIKLEIVSSFFNNVATAMKASGIAYQLME